MGILRNVSNEEKYGHGKMLEFFSKYHKVASINTSRLESRFRFYKLFMKGKSMCTHFDLLKKNWFPNYSNLPNNRVGPYNRVGGRFPRN